MGGLKIEGNVGDLKFDLSGSPEASYNGAVGLPMTMLKRCYMFEKYKEVDDI